MLERECYPHFFLDSGRARQTRYAGAMPRWSVALLAVAFVACGDGAGPAGSGMLQPGVVDLPGGIKRVTLTGNYTVSLDGQGWDVAAGRITPDPVGSDFHLTMTMVVQLAATEQGAGFCRKQPAGGGTTFTRLEDIPADAASCTGWSSAQFGGNTEHSESMWAGQGYLWRDRVGTVKAKLLIVDDHGIGGDVDVTFDIVGL